MSAYRVPQERVEVARRRLDIFRCYRVEVRRELRRVLWPLG